jgi:hypothetical protein
MWSKRARERESERARERAMAPEREIEKKEQKKSMIENQQRSPYVPTNITCRTTTVWLSLRF